MSFAVESKGNGSAGGGRAGWRVLFLLSAMGAGASCTDANESLIVLQAQRPDDMCIVSDDPTGNLRHDRGVLDVALDQPYGYEMFPLVANNMLPIAAEGEIEPNRVW